MNANDLYELAGMPADNKEPMPSDVPAAIQADPALTPRQRRALLGVYEALVDANPANRQRKRRLPAATD